MPVEQQVLVVPCPAAQRVDAVGCLAAVHQPRAGLALARALDSAGDADWSGLIAALSPAGRVLSAIWVQPLPGSYALVWTPPDDCPQRDALLFAAAQWCDQRGFAVSQVLLAGEPGEPMPEALARAGFPRLATMLYLQSEGHRDRVAAGTIEWDELDPDDSARFARLFPEVERDSLDFPELHGVRPVEAVREGFRGQGTLEASLWRVLIDAGQEAGLLVMAPHPGTDVLELVYMGLTIDHRGRGLGRALVAHALDLAHQRQCRVLVALDARNLPAHRVYTASGFRGAARVELHARVFGRRSPDC